MNHPSCKVLVCCHKPDVFATQDPFYPIHVGKAISQVDLGILGDDTGDNISSKNGSYCELTGLYWAWKNLKNVSVIGLCHYRRYFDFYSQGRHGFPYTSFKTSQFQDLKLDIPESVLEQVNEGAVVMAKSENFRHSLFQDYCECHISDDIRTLNIIVQATQSQEFKDAFFKVIYQGNHLRHYNMFLMNWESFDRYCSWLFPLLEEAEKSIDISHYNPTQKRIFGYMSERLINVWVEATHCKIIEKPVLWFNDKEDRLSQYPLFRYRLRVLVNNIAHFFSKPRNPQ
ncbi:MAG: DUF4422 domain-containing protein [Bacteroidales bacterium]|nr:DUF4422 domain-containing protein [Bacteroidales bacterium]